MQITRQTEYAIRTIMELARAPYGEFVQTRLISERQQVPELFLKKTIQALSKGGLVVTQRGAQGGVRLARPADTITIADVLTIIEGPLALNVCLGNGFYCANSDTCKIHRILKRAQKALLQELTKETFADIVSGNIL
ncbi:RrF2 family transcriptional regulator [Desulfurispora thermophila]|uniref:RrF2 family transcriptional regulator n=1 Tax=Desulfurispora thermophila TaxID=265470 RepID=UPI00036C33F6|nr:Rrf2 family transcriptional regulator [Desulfurispora thermophila]